MSEIAVRAVKDGYYDDVYRKTGDDFVIGKTEDFSGNWMVAIDASGNALAKQPTVGGAARTAKEARALADAAAAARQQAASEKPARFD
jgi:hypothetical protein